MPEHRVVGASLNLDEVRKLNEICEAKNWSVSIFFKEVIREQYLTHLKENVSYQAYLDYVHGKSRRN